ncbi:MAG: glycosyltransferase family 4 protein [Agarilytica sp.]
MRILILADDCNPDWPSLPVVGYKFAKAIAEHAEVVVVTHVRNQPYIDRDGLGKAEVVYVDTEKLAAPLFKLSVQLRGGEEVGWTTQMAMGYPGYLYFEWQVWKRFGAEIKAGKFDVVHRITPMTPTLPSLIAKRCKKTPFVLGPLNGNLPWPKEFMAEQKRERETLSRVRHFYKCLPYHRSTYKKSRCILAAFSHTIEDLPRNITDKTINYPEVGIDPELFSYAPRAQNEKKTILYVGRLVPYKCPEVIVRAFATSPTLRKHKLLMVGDGPERPRLQKIIDEHQLEDCVELAGRISQEEVGQVMRTADIFAFPSIRELGAGVVVEAMACGLTSVVVDYGGPATLIDKDRGVKVPMGDIDFLVDQFRIEIEALVQDPERIEALGKAAYKHAVDFYSWDCKAKKLIDIYNWVKDPSKTKPSFWQPSEQ